MNDIQLSRVQRISKGPSTYISIMSTSICVIFNRIPPSCWRILNPQNYCQFAFLSAPPTRLRLWAPVHFPSRELSVCSSSRKNSFCNISWLTLFICNANIKSKFLFTMLVSWLCLFAMLVRSHLTLFIRNASTKSKLTLFICNVVRSLLKLYNCKAQSIECNCQSQLAGSSWCWRVLSPSLCPLCFVRGDVMRFSNLITNKSFPG